MTDTRISLSLTIGLLALAIAVIAAVQPYSVRSPWSVYDAPGKHFLSAALRRDTAELRRLSVSPTAVDWAMRTRRDHSGALSVWARFARAGAGVIQSDTSTVLFDTATEVCPLVITFVGHDSQTRVVEARSRCYSAQQGPM